MNFKFDDKDYDSDKLSEQGKIYLDKLQNILVRKNQLANEYSDIQVLEKHYTDLLKAELPEEDKQEEKKKTK
jgi:uncharacterized Fe-S cluster-containing protein